VCVGHPPPSQFAVPFFKIMEMLLTVLYWQQLSATGKSMNVLVTMEICAVVFAKVRLTTLVLLPFSALPTPLSHVHRRQRNS
jgi:hypothetical protein